MSKTQIHISPLQIRDLKNIATGAYAPLKGYLYEDDFHSVLRHMRLVNESIWPIPIVLDLQDDSVGSEVELLDENGELLATVTEPQVYPNPKEDFAKMVFGTTDSEHPGVANVFSMGDYLLGGRVHYHGEPVLDPHTITPQAAREEFSKRGWKTVVAFQTRNAPHRSHELLQKNALDHVDGLFINPVIGRKKTGDLVDEAVFAAYETLVEHYYKKDMVYLAGLPLDMRYAGPREAVLHAIIRRNYGCSHFIIGRDHAGVGSYYGTYDAHNIFSHFDRDELGIEILKFDNASYCHGCEGVVSQKSCPHDPATSHVHYSGTKFRSMLKEGQRPPREFMRPEVVDTLLSFDKLFVE